jgi:hypothetical protein
LTGFPFKRLQKVLVRLSSSFFSTFQMVKNVTKMFASMQGSIL